MQLTKASPTKRTLNLIPSTCCAMILLALLPGKAAADLVIPGGEWWIDYAVDDNVHIRDSAIVHLKPGGAFLHECYIEESSRLLIEGGYANWTQAQNQGTCNMSSGTVGGLNVTDSGTINVTGGTFYYGLTAHGYGVANVSNVTIPGIVGAQSGSSLCGINLGNVILQDDVLPAENAYVNATGGELQGNAVTKHSGRIALTNVYCSDSTARICADWSGHITIRNSGTQVFQRVETLLDGTMDIYGGVFRNYFHNNATGNIYGGDFFDDVYSVDGRLKVLNGRFRSGLRATGGVGFVDVWGGTVEDILRTDYAGSMIQVNGTGFNYPYGSIGDVTGHLTGTLWNGNTIDVDFSRVGGGSIVLALPEPGTAGLLLSSVCVAVFGRPRRHG